jgi:membrane protease YdiL (CAAX protease family)
MDAALVGFIIFMVKVLHRRSFQETIHWYRRHPFRNGTLVSLGATLALTVAVVSSMFPPKEPPAIEKLITTVQSLYIFALFGIILAPLFEEIIFRGFLFKIFFDMAGPLVAVVMTAFLFALLHVPQLLPSWAGIVMIFVVGLVLGTVRQRSSSLIPPLIVHTAYNGMLFAMYALSTFVQKGTPPS